MRGTKYLTIKFKLSEILNYPTTLNQLCILRDTQLDRLKSATVYKYGSYPYQIQNGKTGAIEEKEHVTGYKSHYKKLTFI